VPCCKRDLRTPFDAGRLALSVRCDRATWVACALRAVGVPWSTPMSSGRGAEVIDLSGDSDDECSPPPPPPRRSELAPSSCAHHTSSPSAGSGSSSSANNQARDKRPRPPDDHDEDDDDDDDDDCVVVVSNPTKVSATFKAFFGGGRQAW
jgi:hypothetical protein